MNPCAVCGHDLKEHTSTGAVSCTHMIPFGDKGCRAQCLCEQFHFNLQEEETNNK